MVKRIYQKWFSESFREKIALLRKSILNYKNLPEDVVYFKRKKMIFIHIPKAAGISVYKTIFDRNSYGHRTMRHYQEHMNQKEFGRCYKFTFVRNPYDRIQSAYYYLKSGGRGRPYDIKYSKEMVDFITFEDFVLNWLDKDNLYKMEHFCPQVYYLKNTEGKVRLDFIGKFENLKDDFDVLTSTLNIDKKLDFLNKTKSAKTDYRKDYSTAMIKKVNDLYHEDFECLGYEKIEP